jgi:hypothetical protein
VGIVGYQSAAIALFDAVFVLDTLDRRLATIRADRFGGKPA